MISVWDRSFIGEDVHIDEIVAAAQNLLEKPREREAAVAVRGPRFLKGEDVHVDQVVPAATTHQGTPAAPPVTFVL